MERVTETSAQPGMMFGGIPPCASQEAARLPSRPFRKESCGYITLSRKGRGRRRQHRRAVVTPPANDGNFPPTMDGDSRIPSRYERYHRDVSWKHDIARCRDSIDVPLTGHGRALSLKGFPPAGAGNDDCHSQGWWLARPARVDEMHDDAAHDGRIHARLPCCLERDGNARCTFTRLRYNEVVAWRQAIAAEPNMFLPGHGGRGPFLSRLKSRQCRSKWRHEHASVGEPFPMEPRDARNHSRYRKEITWHRSGRSCQATRAKTPRGVRCPPRQPGIGVVAATGAATSPRLLRQPRCWFLHEPGITLATRTNR